MLIFKLTKLYSIRDNNQEYGIANKRNKSKRIFWGQIKSSKLHYVLRPTYSWKSRMGFVSAYTHKPKNPNINFFVGIRWLKIRMVVDNISCIIQHDLYYMIPVYLYHGRKFKYFFLLFCKNTSKPNPLWYLSHFIIKFFSITPLPFTHSFK